VHILKAKERKFSAPPSYGIFNAEGKIFILKNFTSDQKKIENQKIINSKKANHETSIKSSRQLSQIIVK